MWFWPFKKTKTTSASPQEQSVVPEFSLLSYPKSKYKVYWETVHTVTDTCIETEVRFIGYSDNPHLSIHRITSVSMEEAEASAIKLVKSKMNDYVR